MQPKAVKTVQCVGIAGQPCENTFQVSATSRQTLCSVCRSKINRQSALSKKGGK